LIFASGAGWYRQLRGSIKVDFRADFQRAKDAEDLPPEMHNLDFEMVWNRGFGGMVSSETIGKINISRILRDLWYVWGILVGVIAFGIARWMSPQPTQQESQQ
jgi:hypothetical protein